MLQTNRLPADPPEERNVPMDVKKPSRGREKKRVEYAGSRWAGVVLLLVTALVSLFFSLQGRGMTVPIGNVLDRVGSFLFGSSTMTFER